MIRIRRKSIMAVYEQVREQLREKIATGAYKAGEIIPDERSLARELHLSRMTVRRAIVDLTHDGLLTRIRGKGTFVRGSFAPQAKRRPGKIALVTSFDRLSVNSLWYYRLVESIYEGAEAERLTLVFKKATDPADAFIADLRRDPSITGIVVVGIENDKLLKGLGSLKVPVVLCDSVPPQPAMFDESNYTSDGGVFTAVRSLLHLGHVNIGLIAGEHTGEFTRQREAAYRRALASYNVPVRKEMIFRCNLSEVAAYAMVRKALHSPDAPTAFFCIVDELALAVIAAVKDHGWRVPNDVSVVGFGDSGHFCAPTLSTVRIPIAQMGLGAIKLLCDRFENPTAPLQRLLAPSEFVSRASCDVPRHVATPVSVLQQ
jgi:GntR family transcriptional regulator of arabinose operon